LFFCVLQWSTNIHTIYRKEEKWQLHRVNTSQQQRRIKRWKCDPFFPQQILLLVFNWGKTI
jgi:hypothetical protein